MTGTNYVEAAHIIERFEGFSPYAYWDVNHYRIGFGSDTRTRHQIPVKQHDHTTRQEALENLEVRLPIFEHRIIGRIGLQHWQRLPQQARGALLSVCYNYGTLPSRVANVVAEGGSLQHIADAVYGLRYDNHGVNKTRRQHEAELIRSAEHGS